MGVNHGANYTRRDLRNNRNGASENTTIFVNTLAVQLRADAMLNKLNVPTEKFGDST